MFHCHVSFGGGGGNFTLEKKETAFVANKISSDFTKDFEKNIWDIPLYWLVNRDPYIGLWNNPHIVGALYQTTNQGPFNTAHMVQVRDPPWN